MTKIQVVYNKDKDSILMVENGKSKFYDESITSTNFLSYFLDENETIEDFNRLIVEEVLNGYDILQADFKHFASEKEQQNYFEFAMNCEPEGILIFDKEK